MIETKRIQDKEAYRQIKRCYHMKLEFAEKNYLNIKIEKFKGNGKSYYG